jgi:hypothetical protein
MEGGMAKRHRILNLIGLLSLISVLGSRQYRKFFVRGEASYVQAMSYTSGDVFGNKNQNPSQVRGLIETGLLF